MTRRARTARGPLAAASLVLALIMAGFLFVTDAPAPSPSPSGEPTAAPAAPAGPVLDSAAAVAAVEALPDVAYRDDGSYAGHRDDLFGESWSFDFDGNDCDARNDILSRDLMGVTLRSARCVVGSGMLDDPYSGERIGFEYGADTSAAVQIDHLLPLKAVYATGGQAWSFEKRRALANDPVNLLAVKGSENGSKSDSLPSEWLPGLYPDVSDRHDAGQRIVWDDLPSDTALQCWYVKKLVPVFVAYELGVTPEDRAAMSAVLRTC